MLTAGHTGTREGSYLMKLCGPGLKGLCIIDVGPHPSSKCAVNRQIASAVSSGPLRTDSDWHRPVIKAKLGPTGRRAATRSTLHGNQVMTRLTVPEDFDASHPTASNAAMILRSCRIHWESSTISLTRPVWACHFPCSQMHTPPMPAYTT